jgi:hypothetical protein
MSALFGCRSNWRRRTARRRNVAAPVDDGSLSAGCQNPESFAKQRYRILDMQDVEQHCAASALIN